MTNNNMLELLSISLRRGRSGNIYACIPVAEEGVGSYGISAVPTPTLQEDCGREVNTGLVDTMQFS